MTPRILMWPSSSSCGCTAAPESGGKPRFFFGTAFLGTGWCAYRRPIRLAWPFGSRPFVSTRAAPSPRSNIEASVTSSGSLPLRLPTTMGTWGTGLFSSDMARDIRDYYRERIEDGIEDTEATRLTVEKFQSYLDDPEEGTVFLIALAVTQSTIGRLDPVIRDRALAAIDSGA